MKANDEIRIIWMRRALENNYSLNETDRILGILCPILDRLDHLKQEAIELANKREKAQKQFEEELKSIEREKAAFIESCCHYSTTYHPDASGNNDSFETCDVCGAEL
jgi:tRNA(Ser,Leu) C12 N-acetylase TAN1